GVAPVSMPITDVMTGLQTDLLDSVAVPPVGAVVLQWHTRLKYITDLPLAYVYAAILIERKAFERLQAEDQAVVHEVLEKVYQGFDESGNADNLAALQALQNSGLELVSPEAAEVETWRKAIMAAQVHLGSKGEFDPALLQQMQQLLAEHRSRAGS
ncbi:MAG TPA: TRAP transporter substrate-binding protein DctP, partial [Xanthomonadales bacterium]|nr:TRAP transporter substrate-binding protein DctP [Xanthomonadales bacterium]